MRFGSEWKISVFLELALRIHRFCKICMTTEGKWDMFWCPFVLFCDQMYQSSKVYHCLCGQARGEQINRERLHFSLSQRWATHNLPLITGEKSFHYNQVDRVLRDVHIVGMCLSPGRSNKLTLSELGHCVESYSKISSKIPTTLFSSMKKTNPCYTMCKNISEIKRWTNPRTE